jgi:hypothetical protein
MRAVPTNESDRPAHRCGGDTVLKQLFLRSMTVRYAAIQVVVWLLFYAAVKLT